ncbi:DNA-directed RNA polymerase [Thecamonas trahens ATCC 50062]|uniref:DNA-directed RNA polymerase subunit n=2 Tax=Thecamonas trahens TaxID=529818 RepID=A0A0L0DPK7_THETB|nr:DNA-directed RNA polymerase [Thecamonas trahens ATCC 50062]KNC53956.1 DNA-directed RNA polymerase [Thecamonas trahens ATCC 50062]|eukprot:XP_013754158.1 DNA-directed RNA polymerase [Thecamonas trahens ATCC 50062]
MSAQEEQQQYDEEEAFGPLPVDQLQMAYLFEPSPQPLKTVSRLQFGVLSPEAIRESSVALIDQPDTWVNGKPRKGGLSDPRLGTIDFGVKCQTCGQDHPHCPGHFGHLDLSKAVYHLGFINYVLKILRCVCVNCSRLLIDVNDVKYKASLDRAEQPQDRLFLLSTLCSTVTRCPSGATEDSIPTSETSPVHKGCGNYQPTYRRDGIKIRATYGSDKARGQGDIGTRKTRMSAEQVREIFARISDKDCLAMGLSPKWARPEWLITTVMPIPPPAVRPHVMMSSTQRNEDDLTLALAEIIKANKTLSTQIINGSPQNVINEFVDLLQHHTGTYISNTSPAFAPAENRSGRPLKTISERLKGKEGRVRGNLMGKRVDFSARTVITPDPNLNVDQVGVPRSIAANLTFPEYVTAFNRESLMALVRNSFENGPDAYPGAKTIIRDDGTKLDLRYISRETDLVLAPGYVVERHVRDGDVVVFNRQPSLHKMSMMGHKIKVMPYSTFRLNLSVTTPYNADFDGDEMNLHVPQSLGAKAEVMEIMMVPKNIVTPASNRPVMGIVQDTLLGTYLFTSRDTFMERDLVMNLLMWVPDWDGRIPTPAILKPKPLWTGKQLFSLIMPNVNLRTKSGTAPDKAEGPISPTDTKVLIEAGVHLSGRLCKKTVGNKANGLIHLVWIEHGPEAARSFLDAIQRVVNNWLCQHAFSVGIGDMVADDRTMANIHQLLKDAKVKVRELIHDAQQGKLVSKPGMTMRETFEAEVNSTLNIASGQGGTSAGLSLRADNRVKIMVDGGSKGSSINIGQMVACVGQQNVEGKRIPYGFVGRTLPHFHKDDYGPESRGFVTNSYLKGLTPQEFYFHAMGGREGLIDTAVKTAKTGYVQRRLVKAMESLMVQYDSTVRNAQGVVIQFLYGEDGMEATLLEHQFLDSAMMTNERLHAVYSINTSNEEMARYTTPQVWNELKESRALREELKDEFNTIAADRDMLRRVCVSTTDMGIMASGSVRIVLPVNLKRLIWNAQKIHSSPSSVSDLSPHDIITGVRSLLDDLVVCRGDDPITREAQANATMLFKAHVRATLASKRVLREYKLSSAAFEWLLGEIRTKFLTTIAHPGEMVGALAAQSIGEPATQMTLNTFHFAGVSAKNVTLGVPRLEELINVAKANRTPSNTVFLAEHIAFDQDAAKAVLHELQNTTLGHVTDRTEIWFDPDPLNTVVEEDRQFVTDYYGLEDMPEDEIMSPWLLRIVLSREELSKKSLKVKDVEAALNREFVSLHVITTPDTADPLVVRVRFQVDSSESGKEEAMRDNILLTNIQSTLLSIIRVKGFREFKKVFLTSQEIMIEDPETGTYDKRTENYLETEGVDLQRLLAHPAVDATRTTSNSVVEVIQVLGIEAARQALFHELHHVISFGGSYVNYRHLALLSDVMTYRGELLPITRHGTNRVENGALMRCSFEETTDVLMLAAAMGEVDPLAGVSEAIIMGNLPRIGTGAFDLFLDESKLADAVEVSVLADSGDALQYVPMSPGDGFAAATPYAAGGMLSPAAAGGWSPAAGGSFSPATFSPGGAGFSPAGAGFSPAGAGFSPAPASPGLSPASPAYTPSSPAFQSPASPAYSPTSPAYGAGSPASPAYSPTSPAYGAGSPTSPAYSPTSPAYGAGSPTSPSYSPTSPAYGAGSPTSPSYSPTSPAYGASPTSPSYSPTSPAYGASPTSPSYSPTSPAYGASPTSPSYSPSSPAYGASPTSPSYSPSSPAYGASPTSPSYSPSSPAYGASPTSPTYSPTSPTYGASPTSPVYSPSSPTYGASPTSPVYSPSSPAYGASPTSPVYSPTSPTYDASPGAAYSPSSPQYNDNDDEPKY